MWYKKIERKFKSKLPFLLKIFLKRHKRELERADLAQVKKILVVRQDERIGNLILTTPFLSALRKFCPGARICYLASGRFHELFCDSDLVDEILIVDKRKYLWNPFKLISLVRKIRGRRFDLAFDLSDENEFSLNNSLITYLSKARYRIGHKKENSDIFLSVEVPKPEKPRHVIDMHLDLLRSLLGDFESFDLNLTVSSRGENLISQYLESKGVLENDFLVGINLGARGRKRWTLSSSIELARWLKEQLNFKIIFIHGSEEKKLIKELRKLHKEQFLIADVFPLNLLSALLKRCDLLISGDSGAMHLSVSVGTPTLAIFLDSDHIKYGPRGEKHQILLPEDGEVSVHKVKEKILDMIKDSSENEFLKLEANLIKHKQ
jgi:ADP-heptose:LPS heptosyltransferase